MLDVLEPVNKREIRQLQKAGGIYLIKKYLPDLCRHKKVFSINSMEEWEKIKNRLPEIVTVRIDSKLGEPIPKIGGTTRTKDKVPEYMKEGMQKIENPSFLCMELEKGSGERVDTKGGCVIDATMGGRVYIGYTGQCFDCRELTKGKAEHETWELSWNDIPFVKPGTENKYHTHTISQQGYRNTAVERMMFLIKEYPERKKEIISKMPKYYEKVNSSIITDIFQKVLVPMWLQKEELLKDGLTKFDIEMNILADGIIVPMEICRPERFKVKGKEEKKDGAR